jgi:hypothetical protein
MMGWPLDSTITARDGGPSFYRCESSGPFTGGQSLFLSTWGAGACRALSQHRRAQPAPLSEGWLLEGALMV